MINYRYKILLTITTIAFFYTNMGNVFAGDLSKTSSRDKRWEVSLLTKYIDSTKIDFNGGAQASLNKEWGWGFGFAYNYSKKWNFGFDISGTNVGYSGTRVEDNGDKSQVSGRLSTSSSNFSAIYNFTNKRFTPFVGASLGWIFIDTNIADGPPGSVCWYDPWWGYICSGYQPTKTTTEFSYGLNMGLRLEVNRDMFLRGSVGRTWADLSNTSNSLELDNFRFDIGIMF
ncbi:MAG: outer membrane beta-barrel protein [Gammaproteobacteria bacterium]